ncbi:MAG: glutamine--fructose-6-phosphate transaminase (isomerizing) [Candidatus Moraniibacteriota bacterium]
MCGIVGYIGKRNALPVLMDGLKRLEYRGYDSAGISLVQKKRIKTWRAVGRVSELEKKIDIEEVGNVGIAHTRWATHGEPSEKNAHPHSDCGKNISLVHNGIIENYAELKKLLSKKGHRFSSETDTEVVVHLIEELAKKKTFMEALTEAVRLLEGTYGLAIITSKEPGKLYCARKGSPLILGVGKDEFIVASDASAIVSHTKKIVYLEDGEIAEISQDGFNIFNAKNHKTAKQIFEVNLTDEQVKKQGFPHFMLKEIHQQPDAVRNALRGRVEKFLSEDGGPIPGGLLGVEKRLKKIKRIVIVACGTSYYAGLAGKYLIEEFAGLPTEVDYASEFRYRKNTIDEHTAVLAISQSGETADTLEAIREAKLKGALTLGIVNTVGSTIARETDAGIYCHAGPEIGVASTKAFSSQLSILVLLTLTLGRQRRLSFSESKALAIELQKIPEKIEAILKDKNTIKKLAKKYAHFSDWLYLGRKYSFPIALEGALKIKEISYVHAEGYAAGEMKHGPIALIDEKFPSFFIAPTDSVYEKTMSGMQEVKARKGKILAVVTAGNKKIKDLVDDVVYIPAVPEAFSSFLSATVTHLFAYYVGTAKGYDVDRPRNLAKSVTVE